MFALLSMMLEQLGDQVGKFVVFGREIGNTAIVFVAHFCQLTLHLGRHGLYALLQPAHFRFESIYVIFGVLFRFGCAFDLMEQVGTILLKLFMVESHVFGRLWIDVIGQDGVGSQLAKTCSTYWKISDKTQSRSVARTRDDSAVNVGSAFLTTASLTIKVQLACETTTERERETGNRMRTGHIIIQKRSILSYYHLSLLTHQAIIRCVVCTVRT